MCTNNIEITEAFILKTGLKPRISVKKEPKSKAKNSLIKKAKKYVHIY